ncbi:MAG TPA: response regulator [Hyphomicrobiaceae bacterium]|nr:response regulator [Hyphomicrobiaceae bacterium]
MARILLADDDAAMRDLAKRALLADGHEVTVVQDGQDALEAIEADPKAFDLLISDVQMPGLDGLSLARSAVQANPALRIVLMTAYAGSVSVPDGLSGNIRSVLTKPLTLDQIKAAARAA